jgi:CHAD domain-containing protein/HD superfamily phosphodiesterase
LKPASKSVGLRYWMKRVLEECDHVSSSFSADPVHDLRVALRRCRSMADGMMAMDPDPDWKAMKKAGKRLFQRLGDLRDVQIMIDWIEKLHPVPAAASGEFAPALPAPNLGEGTAAEPAMSDSGSHDPASRALIQILQVRETQHKHEARAALDEFDRKQWRQWSKSLPARAARIRPGSAVFKHLALERWTAARELHTRALRNRSQIALHMLRIGIKRFRYIVENFLPAEHKAWSDDLKHMQDLLGEVHDLDVLWATALSCRIFPDADTRKSWHAQILGERTKRIDEYRKRMTGPDSLWDVWRAGLPQGKQVQQIATRRVKLWARVLDPDFAHSERVARLALELYDGVAVAGLLGLGAPQADGSNPRSSLYIAGLLHDVGKSKGNKGHHKQSLELIRKHETPLGWSAEDMRRAAIVARFHCGALPVRSHKALRDLPSDEQRTVIRLAAILRLANALDGAHDGHVQNVTIEKSVSSGYRGSRRSNGSLRSAAIPGKNEAVVIAARGFSPGSSTAQTVAAERYLLETVLRRPVIVKPAKAA